MLSDPSETQTVSVEEAGRILRISKNTAYAGVHSGDIPSIRIGRRILVPTAGLRRLLSLDADDA